MDVGHFVDRLGVKVRSNLAVWVVISTLVVSSGYMELMATPAKRMFSLVDPAISNPFELHEKYNDAWLMIMSVFVPIVLFTGVIFADFKISDKFHTFYNTLVEFCLGVSTTMFLTTFLKIRLAKLRPDFLERCGPALKLLKNANATLYDESVCTAPMGTRILADGYKSCPSGHSSMSVVGLGFVSLWLIRRYYSKSQVKSLVVFVGLLPTLLALDVATSRISDFRHSYVDVMSGCVVGIVGLAVAAFAHEETDDKNEVILPV